MAQIDRQAGGGRHVSNGLRRFPWFIGRRTTEAGHDVDAVRLARGDAGAPGLRKGHPGRAASQAARGAAYLSGRRAPRGGRVPVAGLPAGPGHDGTRRASRRRPRGVLGGRAAGRARRAQRRLRPGRLSADRGPGRGPGGHPRGHRAGPRGGHRRTARGSTGQAAGPPGMHRLRPYLQRGAGPRTRDVDVRSVRRGGAAARRRHRGGGHAPADLARSADPALARLV